MKKKSLLIDNAGGIKNSWWLKRAFESRALEVPPNVIIVDKNKKDAAEEKSKDDKKLPSSTEIYFKDMISYADTMERLIAVENFVEKNDKDLLREIAYGKLLSTLGDEKSTDFEIACAYYITGLCYSDPPREYVCFRTACEFLNFDYGAESIYEAAQKKKEAAKSKIMLDDALKLNQ